MPGFLERPHVPQAKHIRCQHAWFRDINSEDARALSFLKKGEKMRIQFFNHRKDALARLIRKGGNIAVHNQDAFWATIQVLIEFAHNEVEALKRISNIDGLIKEVQVKGGDFFAAS